MHAAVALASFAAGLEADPYAFFPLWIGDSHPCGDESNNFQALDLHSNLLTGPLPASWGGMNQLEVLDASSNKLTGTLPSAWNLGANGMIGGLPQQWATGMDSLRGVNITDNSLSGSLPEEWANMTSLQALSMGSNRLTGSIPATWAKLTNLYVVNVTRNEGICGVLPTGVPQNMVEGASTTSLNNTCSWEGDAHPLQEWKASLQDTTDVLASWKQGTNPCGAVAWQGVLCDGWSVVSIQLPSAGLKGPINEGLTRLASLQSLQLNNNQLSGTLPLWQDAPHSLNNVDLASNNLQGTLPANWSKSLLSLQLLNLSSNALQGELPDSWAAFSYLTTL
eukprot:gene10006-10160_t